MGTPSLSSFTGEYYLQGVREMASGFLLKPDGKFQFFFTYGALDRYASGDWIVKDGILNLQSAPKPEYDFALLFEFCPERFSVIKIGNHHHNDFEFRIEF